MKFGLYYSVDPEYFFRILLVVTKPEARERKFQTFINVQIQIYLVSNIKYTTIISSFIRNLHIFLGGVCGGWGGVWYFNF